MLSVQQPHLSHPKYRPDIDGLRAVAVLAVVAFHAFPSWVRGGFIGVDVFFVISGYLISTIIFENLDKGTFSFTEFYARRIKRIFPALLLVLIACFAFGWFALLADEYKQLGKHIAAGAGFISNFTLWNEAGYFDNSAETKPLLHLWSLSIEEQFYIVWPLLLWFAWKRKFNLLTITIVVAIASFIFNIKGIKHDMLATFYSPQTRFWELLSGSLLAWVTLYKKDTLANVKLKLDYLLSRIGYSEKQEAAGKTLSNVLSFIGLLLLVYGFWRINKELSFPGKWALVPVLGAVLIITAGSKAWVNRTILSNKVAVWFGLISYPLYLWHWPILSFARIIESEVPSRNIRIAAVVLSIVLAWLTYKLVERPLRFGNYSKVKVMVLVVLMTIVGYVGYYTYEREGLKFRALNKVNEEVNNALSYNWKSGYRFGECFIYALDEKTNKFSPTCGLLGEKNKPMLMIWGDSHSAGFFRGFEKYGSKLGFLVSQFNASGCPPILDFFVRNRKECINSNNYVFNQIKRLKPDVLVLGANWEMYDGSPESKWEKLDGEKFISTLRRVKEAGVKNIVVIGQLPIYSTNQADLLKRKFLWTKVDTVTYKNFKPSAIPADSNIRDLSLRSSVKFISPLDLLCQTSGCAISIPGDKITPLSYDYGHLTAVGSEYLVSKFFQNKLIKVSD
jgi:peptidoglycan/LPS O-acetylase OafA/YrhL